MDAHNSADDVDYFSRVVDHLVANANADPQSVFASGMSNGGFMANRLACAWAASGPRHVGPSNWMVWPTPPQATVAHSVVD